MRIHSNNKYIAQILGKLFRIDRKCVEFIFIQELYDNEVTELAFLNKTRMLFDEQVEKFKEALEQEIANASSH